MTGTNRLDDYRREEIAVRRARQALSRSGHSDAPSDKAAAREAAHGTLRRWAGDV